MPLGPMTPETLPLHDIHLPPAVSWWPPAPGWWLLLCVFSLLIVAIYLARQHWQRRHLRRLALIQLDELERQYREQKNPRELLRGLSRLLRQAAQIHFPQSGCAGLTGEAWLGFLDQQLNDSSFTQGVGQRLADGPYQPQLAKIDAEDLLSLCRCWLQQLPPQPKAQRKQK